MGSTRPYNDDPELPDEDDPVFKLEMFELFKFRGTNPEKIVDEKFRDEYVNWLKENN